MTDFSRCSLIAGAAGGALLGGAAQDAQDAPTPIRDPDGADILGPKNPAREAQDSCTLRPPATDHGTMPNLK